MLYYIKPISLKTSFNLAWEEYILKNVYDGNDIFLLWRNEPSIVVGRNQNVYNEVNLLNLEKMNIPLFRRNSGGGTVFHDLGNLNYTIITNARGKVNNYELMTKTIIDALNNINIKAYFSPKSDIKLDNYKIGGNAQFLFKDILLHHGTILYDTNLNLLNGSLEVIKNHETKAIKSRPSKVTNIKNYTNKTLDEIINYLYGFVNKDIKEITLTNKAIEDIKIIEKTKYLTDKWNYYESPKSTININKDGFEITLTIDSGHISEASIIYNNIKQSTLVDLIINKPFLPKDLSFLKTNYNDLFKLLFK